MRRRRRPLLWLTALVVVGGASVGAWFALRPPEPVRPPVSTEPVRVQVNARFENDENGSPPTTPPPPK